MLPPGITVRRATLDDMESLLGLWRECRLPAHELEPRFTEFQIAVDAQGWILACLGFRSSGTHGHIHSFGCRRGDLEPGLLDLLWERALNLANQTGCLRLWTRDPGPVWRDRGFQPATPSERRDLPNTLSEGREGWLSIKLRDEPLKLLAAEEQLEAYLELERMRTERMLRRGRFIKLVVTALAAGGFLLLLAALVVVLRRGRAR